MIGPGGSGTTSRLATPGSSRTGMTISAYANAWGGVGLAAAQQWAQDPHTPVASSGNEIKLHRELLKEEESINLLRDQVQQMRKIKLEVDRKDAYIIQLQSEVNTMLAMKDENAELRAKVATMTEKIQAGEATAQSVMAREREKLRQLQKLQIGEEDLHAKLATAETEIAALHRVKDDAVVLRAQVESLKQASVRQDELRVQLEAQLAQQAQAAAQHGVREAQLAQQVRALEAGAEMARGESDAGAERRREDERQAERDAQARSEALHRARAEVTSLQRSLSDRTAECLELKEKLSASELALESLTRASRERERSLTAKAARAETEAGSVQKLELWGNSLRVQLEELQRRHEVETIEHEETANRLAELELELDAARREAREQAAQGEEDARALEQAREETQQAVAAVSAVMVEESRSLVRALDAALHTVPTSCLTVSERPATSPPGLVSSSTALRLYSNKSHTSALGITTEAVDALGELAVAVHQGSASLASLSRLYLEASSSLATTTQQLDEERREWVLEREAAETKVRELKHMEASAAGAQNEIDRVTDEARQRTAAMEAELAGLKAAVHMACEKLMVVNRTLDDDPRSTMLTLHSELPENASATTVRCILQEQAQQATLSAASVRRCLEMSTQSCDEHQASIQTLRAELAYVRGELAQSQACVDGLHRELAVANTSAAMQAEYAHEATRQLELQVADAAKGAVGELERLRVAHDKEIQMERHAKSMMMHSASLLLRYAAPCRQRCQDLRQQKHLLKVQLRRAQKQEADVLDLMKSVAPALCLPIDLNTCTTHGLRRFRVAAIAVVGFCRWSTLLEGVRQQGPSRVMCVLGEPVHLLAPLPSQCSERLRALADAHGDPSMEADGVVHLLQAIASRTWEKADSLDNMNKHLSICSTPAWTLMIGRTSFRGVGHRPTLAMLSQALVQASANTAQTAASEVNRMSNDMLIAQRAAQKQEQKVQSLEADLNQLKEKNGFLEMREVTLKNQLELMVPRTAMSDQKQSLTELTAELRTAKASYHETLTELEAQMHHNAALRSQLVETRQQLHGATVHRNHIADELEVERSELGRMVNRVDTMVRQQQALEDARDHSLRIARDAEASTIKTMRPSFSTIQSRHSSPTSYIEAPISSSPRSPRSDRVNAGIAKPPLAPCATSPKDVQPSAGPPASHHIAHVFDLNDASHTSHHQYVTNPTVHTWSATHLSNASESNRWNKQWANNAQHQDPRHPLQNSQPTVDQGENFGTVANHKWERTRGELQAVRHAAEATLTQLMEEEPHHSHKHVSAAEFESLRDHRSAQFTGRDLRNLAASRAHTHHR